MLPKSLGLISILLMLNLGCSNAMESELIFVPAPLDSHNGCRVISVRCGENYYDGEEVTFALHRGYRHMLRVLKTGKDDGLLKRFEIGAVPGGGERHLPLPGPYYSFPIRDTSQWEGATQVDEVIFTKDGKLVKVAYYNGDPKLQIGPNKYKNCAQQLELSTSGECYTPPVLDTASDQNVRRKWGLSKIFKGASSGKNS